MEKQSFRFCIVIVPILWCKRACFVAQNRLFWCVKEPVLKRKASFFVMHWSLSCYAAAILRTFFCAFSAIHSSSNYILPSHLAEYIYTIRQCARPYRSFCLAWQQHRKSYSFNKKKTLFRFSFSIKKMYLCVLNKTRTIYIVQKNK